MKYINSDNKLYIIKRTFKAEGNFHKVVENFNIDEILLAYKVDKLLKDSNGNYHIVNEVKDVEEIENQ